MPELLAFRKGTFVYLRPFIPSDAEALQRWVNDPEVTQFLTRVLPVAKSDEDEWIANQGKDPKNVVLAIVTNDGDELIGAIGLHQIDLVNRNAVTGTMIGEKKYWGKGYGTEAKMLLLDFAFNALDLYVVMSKVYSFNGRSLAYGKKCGYVEVGRIPEWIKRNGKRYDEVLLLVTQDQWRPYWDAYLASKDKE